MENIIIENLIDSNRIEIKVKDKKEFVEKVICENYKLVKIEQRRIKIETY